MGLRDHLKQFRIIQWVYNLFHYRELLHNQAAYRKYHVKKPLFTSISSRDFPDKESKAWLDLGSSLELAAAKEGFRGFTPDIQEQLRAWSENGFIIARRFFPETEVDLINDEIDLLIKKGKLAAAENNKWMYANRVSSRIRERITEKRLIDILRFLLDKDVVPFQTINFLYGSEQKAHSDSIHMTTYPLGFLIAVWIALENTSLDNGPLFYYPGSHRLPYLLNPDYDGGKKRSKWSNLEYEDYEEALEESIGRNGLEKKVFLANKGDIFIWHANLIHGGSPVQDPQRTRKSMVVHYFAKDVIKYHEISERPSVMKSQHGPAGGEKMRP
jgi:ectoine hydroxylase